MKLSRTARVATPALAALALTMALAGPASADPALVTRNGSQILFTAQPGETNTVEFRISGGFLEVNDATAVLIPGPGCVQAGNPNTVRCGQANTVARILATLGDRNDEATNSTSIPSDLIGGEGLDRLVGGTGPDRLLDSDGWNFSGFSGNTFNGREGNDTILSRNGGFDRIECGENPGDLDVLLADQATLDFVASNSCELIQRG
ncbi:hypothetical protein [Streptomyces sp. NBC_00158]|uniref:hypothetical protein n=1 Tax=Streptomyces sp. NBC_00158 TaxID=2903627 RepID=UPI00324F09F3